MNLNIEMAEFSCCQCGVPFLVPSSLWRWRDGANKTADDEEDDRRLIYCPNGHGAAYRTISDGPSKREKELSEEIMHLRHALDQAEARARDSRPAPEESPDAPIPEDPKAKHKCACCGKEYRTFKPYATHMQQLHALEVSDAA